MRARIFWGLGFLLAGTVIGYAVTRYPFFHASNKSNDAAVADSTVDSTDFLAAVSVDNSPEARPQFGLSKARVVFETLAEGGVTRFLAFFPLTAGKEVAKVGPVRSARPYFVDWAYGARAILAHSGGSKEALDEIDSAPGFRDANEFYNEKYFWRDEKRAAPHNLFTSTDRLFQMAAKKNWSPDPGVFGWDTKADEPAPTSTASLIKVNFSTALFAGSFQYDPSGNFYTRSLGGKPQVDADRSQQIVVKNLIVLYSRSEIIDPKLLTIDLQILGSGKAMIFRDGGVLQARWEKNSAKGQLKIVDADGSAVALNDGLTWIAVIDQVGTATWK